MTRRWRFPGREGKEVWPDSCFEKMAGKVWTVDCRMLSQEAPAQGVCLPDEWCGCW